VCAGPFEGDLVTMNTVQEQPIRAKMTLSMALEFSPQGVVSDLPSERFAMDELPHDHPSCVHVVAAASAPLEVALELMRPCGT
jgi:hypothetical protein